ncbi:MAG: flagellar basal body rod protein FlgB [Bdellovibrionales bacterium]
MSLFDKTTGALGAALNLRLQRQNVISGNIANAETPGYNAKKMDFEGELSRALDLDGKRSIETTHAGHVPVRGDQLSRITGDIYDNPDIPVDNDKNTVDLEKEMASLNENSILYKTAVELIRKKLGAMKYAVSEGR